MAAVTLVGSEDTRRHEQIVYNKFTAIFNGAVTEISVYSDSDSRIKVAIYADNIGEPGIKITSNDTIQAVTSDQWNILTIENTNVIGGTSYWLGVAIESKYNSCRLLVASVDIKL